MVRPTCHARDCTLMCSPSKTPGSNRFRKSIRNQIRGVVAIPSGTMPQTNPGVTQPLAGPSQGSKVGWACNPIWNQVHHGPNGPWVILVAWPAWVRTWQVTVVSNLAMPSCPNPIYNGSQGGVEHQELARSKWVSDPALEWHQVLNPPYGP